MRVISIGRVLVALVLCAAAARAAGAQALGYGIAGPAGFTGFFGSSGALIHAAGGGELLAGGRLGGGGEFGVLAGSGGGLVVTSLNGVYHGYRITDEEKVQPFLTGGYTHMSSGEGSFNAWNVGGGVDVWVKPHVGLRVEYRDHIRPDDRGAVHYWTIRAGVVFR
jgi:hypothetical protein